MSGLAPKGRGSAGSGWLADRDGRKTTVTEPPTTAGITMRVPNEAADCSLPIEQLESAQQEEEPSCDIRQTITIWHRGSAHKDADCAGRRSSRSRTRNRLIGLENPPLKSILCHDAT